MPLILNPVAAYRSTRNRQAAAPRILQLNGLRIRRAGRHCTKLTLDGVADTAPVVVAGFTPVPLTDIERCRL